MKAIGQPVRKVENAVNSSFIARTSRWKSCLLASLMVLSLAWSPRSALALTWTVYNNVEYGVGPQETADLYLLTRGVNPAIVFIHGGGWMGGDKSAYAGYYAKLYASAGYNVIAINYRLATYSDPTTQWNAQLQDVQEAIRWVRSVASILHIDPTRIGAAGDSAGGHLALFLGSLSTTAPDLAGGVDRSVMFPTFSPKVQAVLDMFGPTDLRTPQMAALVASTALFGGKTITQVPNLYSNASPIRAIKAGSAPTCIVQGLQDTTVPPAQSTELVSALQPLGIPYQYITYNGGHEFSGLSYFQKIQIDNTALRCMNNYLHPNPLNAL